MKNFKEIYEASLNEEEDKRFNEAVQLLINGRSKMTFFLNTNKDKKLYKEWGKVRDNLSDFIDKASKVISKDEE